MNRLFGGLRFVPQIRVPGRQRMGGRGRGDRHGAGPRREPGSDSTSPCTRTPSPCAASASPRPWTATPSCTGGSAPHGPFARTLVLPFRVDADRVCRPLRARRAHARAAPARGDKPRQVKIAQRLTEEDTSHDRPTTTAKADRLRAGHAETVSEAPTFLPPADILETKDALLMLLDMPGADRTA